MLRCISIQTTATNDEDGPFLSCGPCMYFGRSVVVHSVARSVASSVARSVVRQPRFVPGHALKRSWRLKNGLLFHPPSLSFHRTEWPKRMQPREGNPFRDAMSSTGFLSQIRTKLHDWPAAILRLHCPLMTNAVQGRAKIILLSSVTHVPSGLIGCALAA